VDLASTHTSPSVERSVLLRMGFSSLEARAIVEKCVEKGLLGKGAGHVVWRLAAIRGCGVRQDRLDHAAGRGWNEVAEYFGRRAGGSGR
jgi:D-ornithine 4,5-aminomutase subunit alpha